ncbi:MAG: sigma-54-dependent Fis family transcriptional regulator [Deltaproteobacteria bacterium]|nr:sigma-54-dependent Fis family transcriptional regulator [Deltaproteobacteria bacterium]
METVLVVDDEKNYLLVMEALLSKEGLHVLTAGSGHEALDILRDAEPDLVITDMKMPGLDGLELLSAIKDQEPELPVIVMTAFGTVDKAVEAMKKGAFDYLTKPFENKQMLLTVAKALELSRLVRQNRFLQSQVAQSYGFGNLIGQSKQMRQVYQLIEKVAPTKATVLITGESGTGKELIARAIHHRSPRAGKPFVSVNCSALTETLLESELFGHEKGAFTGATSAHKGRFELADQGSLFLDEIGHTSQALQVKLLRVIQERAFERVGGSRTLEVDVRLITASNKDLKAEADEGRFQEDLYYRLNVVHIELPPLREREDDIPLLAVHFLEKFSAKLGRKGLSFEPEILEALASYPWPGNVRELENVIERAVVLTSGPRIKATDLPPEVRGGGLGQVDIDRFVAAGTPLPEALEKIEQYLIRQALAKADNVQARAAEILGIGKSLLQYKLKKYNLSPTSPE